MTGGQNANKVASAVFLRFDIAASSLPEAIRERLLRLGDLKLQSGMQTTVMVKTGERSLMVYQLSPILRRMTTALSE